MATIYKGWHYSLPMYPNVVRTDKFRRSFVFGNSCRYEMGYPDQTDWNKLTGFTLGCSLHNAVHKDSVRVAWRYNASTEKVELCWYAYNKTKRIYGESELCSVNIGQQVNIWIHWTDGGYTIFVKTDNSIAMWQPDLAFEKHEEHGWECFPYFGGNRTAPHRIKIERV